MVEVDKETCEQCEEIISQLSKLVNQGKLKGQAKAAIGILSYLIGKGKKEKESAANGAVIDVPEPSQLKPLTETLGEACQELSKLLSESQSELGELKASIVELINKLATVIKTIGGNWSGYGYASSGYAKPDEATGSGYRYPYAKPEVKPEKVYPKSPRRIKATASLMEAVEGSEGKAWDVRLIKAGLSANRFYYSDDVLSKSTPLFEGAPAFIDHPSAEDRKAYVERSVRDIAGWYESARKESDGVHATFIVADSHPEIKALFKHIWESNKLDLVGFSIFAQGATRMDRQGGKLVWIVESIDKLDSVDIVTQPAAGGRIVGLVESDQSDLEILDALTPEELAVWQSEKIISGGATNMAEESKLTESVKKVQELEDRLKKFESSVILNEKLSSSNLPEPAKKRLRESLIDRFPTAEDVDKAIGSERDYLGQLSGFQPLVPIDKIKAGASSVDRMAKALDGLLSGSDKVDGVPAFRTLREAYSVFKGKSILDTTPQEVLKEAIGYSSESRLTGMRLAESISTSSWAELLGDSITRAVMREYKLPGLDDWKKLCSIVTKVSDFRTQRRIRLGGYGILPTVSQGATYQSLSSPSDEEVTYTVTKRGGLEDLTWETILNDDLGAVRQIPIRLARAAKVTLYRYVFTLITDNPTQPDALALFHASHGNLGASALTSAALVTAKQAMRDQTAYGTTTEFLQLKPRYLLVPNELEQVSWLLNNAESNPDGAVLYSGQTAGLTTTVARIPNIHRNSIEPIIVDFWTDPDDWYLVADPQFANSVEIAFLGSEEPEVLTQEQPTVGSVFTADKISYKIRHIYGGAPLEWRSFYAGKP